MNLLLAIRWDVDPVIFTLDLDFLGWGEFPLRWYGLLFALGFVFGNYIMTYVYKVEKKNLKDLDTLLFYMVAAIVIGARLGHCLFYNPEYYLQNPLQILNIREGGLASHGAAIMVLIALYVYAKKHPDQPFLWLTDRIVITSALGGAFIRFGNFMNSEIIGKPTGSDWGAIFVRRGPEFMVPHHPAQLYESAICLITFFFLMWQYNRTKGATPHGRLTAFFFLIIFGLRFIEEFFKIPQEDWNNTFALNTGQLLSIPIIIVGLLTLRYSYSQKAKPKEVEATSTPGK